MKAIVKAVIPATNWSPFIACYTPSHVRIHFLRESSVGIDMENAPKAFVFESSFQGSKVRGRGKEGVVYDGVLCESIMGLPMAYPLFPAAKEIMNSKRPKVTKVVEMKEEFNALLHMSRSLSELDPEEEVFIYPYGYCIKYMGDKVLALLEMPEAPGVSLEKLDEHGKKLPLETVKMIYEDLQRALERLHAHNMIHGDLHPPNVMVDVDLSTLSSPKVRLIDFNTVDQRSKFDDIKGVQQTILPALRNLLPEGDRVIMRRLKGELTHLPNWEELIEHVPARQNGPSRGRQLFEDNDSENESGEQLLRPVTKALKFEGGAKKTKSEGSRRKRV